MLISTWYILPVAFILDFFIGDPVKLPHPIRLMGRAIEWAEPNFRKLPLKTSNTGILFALFLIFIAWTISFLLIKSAVFIYPPLGIILEIILLYYCLSARSLEQAAMDVKKALNPNDLNVARKKLSYIVGRQTDKLSETGIIRATVETVAENFVDGVISPLFYAVLGGVPLAITYKMVNTMDSMVGYKNEKYINFGTGAAKIDDFANFIPARISIFLIAFTAQILSNQGHAVITTAFKEGKNHSSPNAGYPEAAFAEALQIKLGGPNFYHGKLVEKPYIGQDFKRVRKNSITKACNLMILSSLLFLGLISFIFFLI
ncbi:MAG: cobalamin biosynthesis protein CobD [Desulfobacteraceae bacterium 4572_19]|nr:MAG: cobalamin biosynthesis protein CobD [Desulfobacteraceae bacterium 4572_19]